MIYLKKMKRAKKKNIRVRVSEGSRGKFNHIEMSGGDIRKFRE